MFCNVFKNTNIIVTIYKKRFFSEGEKWQIILVYHDTPVGEYAGISRTIKRFKMIYQWNNLKQNAKINLKKNKH